MHDDPLSQAEIESLLGAVSDSPAMAFSEKRPAVAAPAPLDAEIAAAPASQPARVFTTGQVLILRRVYEKFCRRAEAALASLLRATLELKLVSIEERTYSEFLFGLDSPVCFNVLRAERDDLPLALDISPAIALPLVDRLLGGGGQPGPAPRRPLTAIELRVIGRVTQAIIGELRLAWQDVQPQTLSFERVARDSQIADLLRANESVLQVTLALTIGAARGPLTVCIPQGHLMPLLDTLSKKEAAGGGNGNLAPPSAGETSDRSSSIRGAMVEIVAELAETTITPQELSELCAGDIITTRHGVSQPVLVRVEGLAKFRARVGQHKGRRAVQIEERVNRAGTVEPGT